MYKLKNGKKVWLLCLAGSMLMSSALTGCSESAETETTAQSAETVTAAETTAEETRPALGLPEMDFAGKSMRIAVPMEVDYNGLYTEGMIGEIVNDAVYHRNEYLQESYNYTLEVFYDSGLTQHDTYLKMIQNLVVAGDDRFELVFNWCYGGGNLAIEGNFIDWYTLPYLSWGREYWPQNSLREMTVYNKMFTVASSITTQMLENAKAIWFNKELLEAYGLESPYEMVREGTWTLDAIVSMTKDVYTDVNGDGKRDPGDAYGYCTIPDNHGYVISTDTPILQVTQDGGREIAVMSEKTLTLIDKMYNWYYENEGVFVGDWSDAAADHWLSPFLNNNAVMAFGFMKTSTQFRETDIVYGVVPHPKFDEAQDRYYSFTRPAIASVPITCTETDMAAFLTEALTYYGYYDVVSAYYETVLQGKIADAPEDAEMMQVINDSLTLSFPYNYENFVGFSNLWGMMKFQKTGGSKDFASVYQQNLKQAQGRLDLVLEGFAD